MSANRNDMSTNRDNLKESLSAMFDGEAKEIEAHRVLKKLSGNMLLRDSWRRYQISSAIIKGNLPDQIQDFSSNIRCAIELEKTYNNKGVTEYFIKPLGRFAVAASVAIVALLGMQEYKTTDTYESSLVTTDNIHVNLASSSVRTSAEFGIPPALARNVATSNLAQERKSSSDEILFQNDESNSDLTREQVQRYLDGLLNRYNQNEGRSVSK
jgi:sigma-E factor negative regulatory protein RseA